MKKVFWSLIIVLMVSALAAYSVLSAQTTKGDLVLISKKVTSTPTDSNSPQWQEAKEATFVLEGAGTAESKRIKQKVKSVYTKDEIFFLFEWPDKDKTMMKNRWRHTDGKWIQIKGDEDMLGVVWEIRRIDKFTRKGCTVFCHNEPKNEKDWYYAVNSNREKADLWHWKSVRSNPVGYTEDGYVTDNPTKEPEEGRKRDTGNKLRKAKTNWTKDKSGPAYMQDPAKKASIPGSLLVDEAIEIKDNSIFKEGDEISGFMLYKEWKDSFADIPTTGAWKDGKWTVMMSRKLDTGNDDDVKFYTRRKYPFGIAVFNNAHKLNSYNSEPLKLQFQ